MCAPLLHMLLTLCVDFNELQLTSIRNDCLLTLSSPVVSNGYTSKCWDPCRSNPIFWHSGTLSCLGLSTRVPECQKIKKGGLDQYGVERFGRLIFATIRKKCGSERVKLCRSSGCVCTLSCTGFTGLCGEGFLICADFKEIWFWF